MPDSLTSRLYAETRTINASAEAVYAALTNFAAYPQWNPWIVAVQGEPVVNATLTATVQEGARQRTVHHRVTRTAAPTRFAWCDSDWFTIFARGERSRTLTPVGATQCHYRCELQITGPLCSVVDWWFGRGMREGLAAEADALQRLCERN